MNKKLQQKVLIGLRDIARTHNFKVVFHNKTSAYVEIADSTVFIGVKRPPKYNLQQEIASIVSAFFHEMAHVVAARDGKFPLYHASYNATSKRHILAIRRTALRAEIFVDNLGQELMRAYFPTLRYVKSYRSEEQRKWLREYYSVL